MKNLTTKRGLRCAIYTRVSTDQGLEQDFNSLDAQREASEAYIKATSNIKARGLFRLIHHKRAPCAERTGFLGRLIFHTSMEATDAFNHLRDRCRDHRPRE